MRCLLALVVAVLSAGAVLGHGGGIDGYGGHNNRSAGNYHFHRGPLSGQTFATKSEAIAALERAQKQSTSSSASPRVSQSSTQKHSPSTETQTATVYITKSGKKYHGASCRYAKTASPISISEAKSRGFSACSVCGGK